LEEVVTSLLQDLAKFREHMNRDDEPFWFWEGNSTALRGAVVDPEFHLQLPFLVLLEPYADLVRRVAADPAKALLHGPYSFETTALFPPQFRLLKRFCNGCAKNHMV
jgi:hypothetical protein